MTAVVEVKFGSFDLLLAHRAATTPRSTAYAFLENGEGEGSPLTFAQLEDRAARCAAGILANAEPYDPVLLLLPPGLEFVIALFGCFRAGVLPLAAAPPVGARLGRTWPRLLGLTGDAGVSAVITTPDLLELCHSLRVEAGARAPSRWLTVNELEQVDAPVPADARGADPHRLAYLQYTSGSTGSGRGVMLSHDDLLTASRLLAERWGHSAETRLFTWLPPYHDLGLIGGLLQAVYLGSVCYFAPPLSFIKRPSRWLEAITRFRITSSHAPNFAFGLCVDRVRDEDLHRLDLSSWSAAVNGGEPVRPVTIRRFAERFAPVGFDPTAFINAWGLAEATLVVNCTDVSVPPRVSSFATSALRQSRVEPAATEPRETCSELVSCGPVLPGFSVAVVDPDTHSRVDPGAIGEIWVRGPSVARGYWGRPSATRETFQAVIADEPEEGYFLRTGDLGFVDDEELFVVGRCKDVLIVHGANYHAHEIEAIAEASDPRLRAHSSAAVQINDEEEDRLVIVMETKGDDHDEADLRAIAAGVRRAVGDEMGLVVHSVVFVPYASVPKTTSGKIQRHLCKSRLVDGSLAPLLTCGQ